ncbi:MAG: DUF5671 domain-containing protein, partial [Candidatus Wildermuthbacteria bacterium]|nr:DUF5671 domain-containing protein [Candidatus Wildermuthbacteria bacterium]
YKIKNLMNNMETETILIKKVSPRDVFIHILTIITLYFSAASFITLLFQYINRLVADPLAPESFYYFSLGPLRFAISSLLIVFPAFITASWFLNKGYVKDPAKRESRLRKWLIYFTLFATALIVLGDLVKLVYEFLGGEVTLRFILKSFSFLLVSGTIFSYYLWDVRRTDAAKSPKYFVRTLCLVIGLAAIGGFFLIGSPKEARARQFDEQRIMDLQNIQWQIVNYWQSKGKLPEKLTDLQDSITGFAAPIDPKTLAVYEYQIKSAESLSFDICATFDRSGGGSQGQIRMIKAVPFPSSIGVQGQSWAHLEGRICFERAIDKDLYPVREKAASPAKP